jgi:hypothetical protein
MAELRTAYLFSHTSLNKLWSMKLATKLYGEIDPYVISSRTAILAIAFQTFPSQWQNRARGMSAGQCQIRYVQFSYEVPTNSYLLE